MLILTRRPGEKIMIGSDIVLTVLQAQGNEVRFGIDAPKAIEIDREEIRVKKDAERKD